MKKSVLFLLIIGLFLLSNCENRQDNHANANCKKTNIIFKNKILENYLDSFISEFNVTDNDALCLIFQSDFEDKKIIHIYKSNKYSNREAQFITYYKSKLLYIKLQDYESVFKTEVNRFDSNSHGVYCKYYMIVLDGDSVYKH